MNIPHGTFRHSEGGLITLIHVYVSNYAVGNGLNLVPAGRKGLREKITQVL